jgi:RimJ/RimL family protein N-acetyltransferase
MYKIRRMRSSDAVPFLELLKQTDAETDFMMQEPGERQMNAFQVSMSIASGMHIIFIAVEEDKIVGHLAAFFLYGRGARIKHAVHIGISVLQSHWGQGIGAALFEAMESWAKSEGIVRLELTVMTHNERGINLYKKMGFEIEGTKKASIFVKGEYVDEFLMSKILT